MPRFQLVQLLNPVEEIHELATHDYLCDVDDPFGYLSNCLISSTQMVSQNIYYASRLMIYVL